MKSKLKMDATDYELSKVEMVMLFSSFAAFTGALFLAIQL